MAKIDIDKLVADLLLIYCDRKGIDRNYAQTVLDDALNKQNLKCVDGNIVSNEPKFKIGDWITNGEYTWQITKVLDFEYELVSPLGKSVKDDIDHVDEYFRLWNLRDAKDGDILIDTHRNSEPILILFKTLNRNDVVIVHCGYNGFDFSVPFDGTGYGTYNTSNYVPANENQRKTLLDLIDISGYEWNEETKELVIKLKILTDEYKAGYRDGNIDCLNKILKYVEVNCPYFSVTYGKELEKLIKNE